MTDTTEEGELIVWGEWEGESVVDSVVGDAVVHRPVVPAREQRPPGVPLNTDPFIFGERFLYTLCGQARVSAKKIHSLAAGSVIVFGSVLRGRFVCDTVFVVAQSIPHTRANWRASIAPLVPDEFVVATLEPMYASPRPEEQVFTLHIGATVDDPVDGMFSFVPCRPIHGQIEVFARPAVDDVPGVSATRAQPIAFNPDLAPGDVEGSWRSLADRVLGQGLALGITVGFPLEQGSARL